MLTASPLPFPYYHSLYAISHPYIITAESQTVTLYRNEEIIEQKECGRDITSLAIRTGRVIVGMGRNAVIINGLMV